MTAGRSKAAADAWLQHLASSGPGDDFEVGITGEIEFDKDEKPFLRRKIYMRVGDRALAMSPGGARKLAAGLRRGARLDKGLADLAESLEQLALELEGAKGNA
jgi:hypothetical protein